MRTRKHGPTKGFSLLEVMVAMTLGMVLLGAVWTMFQMLTRRQESELRQAGQSQVTRAIHQRLSMDLKNLVSIADQRPQPKPMIQSNWTLRPSGGRFPIPSAPPVDLAVEWELPTVLVGTSQELLLQVYLSPLEQKMLSERDGHDRLTSFPSTTEPSPQVPGTKFVRYLNGLDELERDEELQSDEMAPWDEALEPDVDEPFPDLLVGLTRQEFYQPPKNDDAEDSKRADSAFQALNRHEREALREADEPASEYSSEEPYLTEGVEEIANIQFEYFDGQAWTDHWDSRMSNLLPVAIRVRFRYLTKQEIREWNARDEADPSDNRTSDTFDENDDRRVASYSKLEQEEPPDVPEIEMVLLVKPRPFSRQAVREMSMRRKPEEDFRSSPSRKREARND